MKKIEAIIRPHKVDDIYEALCKMGLNEMIITEVKGIGSEKTHTETYRGSQYKISFAPKSKIEIDVPDALAGSVASLIVHCVRTGDVGDGKIVVSSIEKVICVETEEIDESVI